MKEGQPRRTEAEEERGRWSATFAKLRMERLHLRVDKIYTRYEDRKKLETHHLLASHAITSLFFF